MSNVDVTRVAGNIGALNALNSLTYVNEQLAIHQNRLATGKRINYAYEDPAGLNLATTFDVRRQGLEVALNSIGDSQNMMATAEGGLTEIQDILVKMKNKAMEAILGSFWLIAVCVYIVVSFLTNAWHITWIIFLIAAAVASLIRGIFMLKQ